MTLNEKLSDMYDKILSLKDEVASASSRLESGDLDDVVLKQGLNKLENQNFAQTRKVELATQDSKKYCLSLEADALSGPVHWPSRPYRPEKLKVKEVVS